MSTIPRLLPRLPLFFRPLLNPYRSPILPFARGRAPRIHPNQLTAPSRTFWFSHARSQSPQPQSSSPLPDQSLSQRLKHLIKAYGWYALGVYLVIGALDFGVAFAGISLFGAEHVSRLVSAAKSVVVDLIWHPHIEPGQEELDKDPPSSTGSEGIYAMLVLAYTIHKTVFMPVRIGVTAAFTPRLVGWLTRRGWAGRAGSQRAAAQIKERIRDRVQD